MKLIVITRPDFFAGEADLLTALFRAGLEILHLRKPQATREAVEALICAIPEEYRKRIVVHDFFALADAYGLKGIHLNSRNPNPPQGYRGHISCSCHSLDEVKRYKAACDYLFLSPIYDSISKEGYGTRFSCKELTAAARAGIIDSRVIALGGICRNNLHEVQSLGFGGAALLGDVWQQTNIIEHFKSMKQQLTPPIILSIAGSDSSGGAGIQADIKAISALGGYAASAITAVTVQNTQGVQASFPIPTEVVSGQIAAVMDDLRVAAVKIGMVHDAEIARTIAASIRRYRPRHVVYDPVMISTSGHRLLTEDSIECIKEELLPLATLITPNLHEASLLYGTPLDSIARMEEAARTLSQTYGPAVLIKGGHLEGNTMCDVLYCDGALHRFTGEKIDARNLHGTGCTLSSAIATLLGHGHTLPEAVAQAKAYITEAISQGSRMQIGQGNGPVWHFVYNENLSYLCGR